MACEDGKNDEFVKRARHFIVNSDYDGFKKWYDGWIEDNPDCQAARLLAGLVEAGDGQVFKVVKEICTDPDPDGPEGWMQNKAILISGAIGITVIVLIILFMIMSSSKQAEDPFPR